MKLAFTILGAPQSKANSREVTRIGQKLMDVIVGWNDDGKPKTERMKVGGRNMNRKSDEALAYEASALRQVPPLCRLRLEGPVRVTMRIFYASKLSDLDESLILDVLQDRYKLYEVPGKEEKARILIQNGVYRNDRQVKEKHIFHAGIDKANPRAEIEVETMEEVVEQQELALVCDEEDPF